MAPAEADQARPRRRPHARRPPARRGRRGGSSFDFLVSSLPAEEHSGLKAESHGRPSTAARSLEFSVSAAASLRFSYSPIHRVAASYLPAQLPYLLRASRALVTV